MSAALVLFGLTCLSPCPLDPSAVDALERGARDVLAARGWDLRGPPSGAVRPTGETAALDARDEAAALGADRAVVLDLEPSGAGLWVTHFLRGVVGAWSVTRVACAGGRCPGLEGALAAGLRPRRAEDVDVVAGLRRRAGAVGRCVREEDARPLATRVLGRVSLSLELAPSGVARLLAVDPPLVARLPLGACLRGAMEGLDVGPFEGAALRLRVPVDL